MRNYSAWLSDGTEVDYEAKTKDSAINKGIKAAKRAGELLVRIDDVTDIETNEECPIIWGK